MGTNDVVSDQWSFVRFHERMFSIDSFDQAKFISRKDTILDQGHPMERVQGHEYQIIINYGDEAHSSVASQKRAS